MGDTEPICAWVFTEAKKVTSTGPRINRISARDTRYLTASMAEAFAFSLLMRFHPSASGG